jgi:hypothetical protein
MECAAMIGPILHTERTEMRPLGMDDLGAVHALWTDPGVRKYLWDDVVIDRERTAGAACASRTAERRSCSSGFARDGGAGTSRLAPGARPAGHDLHRARSARRPRHLLL